MQFKIDFDNHGLRIDKFLTANTDITRSRVQKAIELGLTTVNGEQISKNFKLTEGDLVEFKEFKPESIIKAMPGELEIIFENKENLINITNYTQISIFAASVSIFKTYQEVSDLQINDINFMLGHSLGEYSALACSQKLSLKSCSEILKKRGELMNNAVIPNSTGMAALIGKSSKDIQKIIDHNKLNLEIANDNSPM